MPKIRLLDSSVAELIAAGEVVERPASIVKELVENSIDSGATHITVEIRGGGIGYIRVSDDGCGITPDDIPTAFLRHATSKVQEADDLERIYTLGFRGEALASIAAVSRVEIITRTAEDKEGYSYCVEGGVGGEITPNGASVGTTLIIRDVFYNVPARMKFLRKDMAEGNAVEQVMDKTALAHPEISFRFIRDTQTKLHTSGSGDLLSVIAGVYGRELAQSMIAVKYEHEGISLSGYISDPQASRPNRSYQTFFINGRYIRSVSCAAAVEEGFQGKLMTGRFPACVLQLEMDPVLVDPNVHPAKTEVRFSEEKLVFNAVFYGVKTALKAQTPPLEVSVPQPKINPLTIGVSPTTPLQQTLPMPDSLGKLEGPPKVETKPSEVTFFSAQYHEDVKKDENNLKITQKNVSNNEKYDTIADDSVLAQSSVSTQVNPETPSFQSDYSYRFIDELFSTYLLLQQEDDLVFIDKHAAHERIRYERLKSGSGLRDFRQVLMQPITVTLQKDEYSVLMEQLEQLDQMGFSVEDFGSGTLIVREMPIDLLGESIPLLLSEVAGKLLEHHSNITPDVLESLYESIACKTAIRAGEQNSREELEEILQLLKDNPDITHCPHGRPIVVRISKRKLESMFGRLG